MKLFTLILTGVVALWATHHLANGASMQEEPREYVMASGDSTITLKRYVMCIYSAGPNRGQTQEEAERIQREHLAYQDSLHKHGIILVAGPFGGAGTKRGIVIYDLGHASEVAPYVTSDPAVVAGRLDYELIEWWTKKGSVID